MLGSLPKKRQERTAAIKGRIAGVPAFKAALAPRPPGIIIILRFLDADRQQNFLCDVGPRAHQRRKRCGVETRFLKVSVDTCARSIGPRVAERTMYRRYGRGCQRP